MHVLLWNPFRVKFLSSARPLKIYFFLGKASQIFLESASQNLFFSLESASENLFFPGEGPPKFVSLDFLHPPDHYWSSPKCKNTRFVMRCCTKLMYLLDHGVTEKKSRPWKFLLICLSRAFLSCNVQVCFSKGCDGSWQLGSHLSALGFFPCISSGLIYPVSARVVLIMYMFVSEMDVRGLDNWVKLVNTWCPIRFLKIMDCPLFKKADK